MEVIYKTTNVHGYQEATIKYDDDYEVNSFALQSSFGNCQNFSIAYFKELLFYKFDYNSYKVTKEGAKALVEILINIFNTWGRPCCVIDITVSTYVYLKQIIHDCKLPIFFIVETAYKSTNGSDMIMCIMKISDLKPLI